MTEQWLSERTYAVRRLAVRGHGFIWEVLPYVFLAENDIYDSQTELESFSQLIFLRNPTIEPGFPKEISEFRIPEDTFLAAVKLLETSIGHGPNIWLNRGDVFDEMLNMPSLIAHAVHLYQVDKLGVPYIEHPRAVAHNTEIGVSENLEVLTNADIDAAIAAAWLHDSLEDSEDFFYRAITEEDLLNWGINERTTHAVKLLTRSDDVPNDIYYSRILTDSVARIVKLADIAHNTNAARVIGLEPLQRNKLKAKYKKALSSLGYHEQVDTWFQPLADLLDNFDLPFTSDLAGEAFADAVTNEALPNRYGRTAKLSEFNQAHEIARAMQQRESFTSQDSDKNIIFGLFWQFYLMQFDLPFKHNQALIAEFYQRKKLPENSESSDDFYPLQSLSIPEIIKRAKRAKTNLENYNQDQVTTDEFGDTSRDHIWSDRNKLSRDEAAELLLVAFGEFEGGGSARIKVRDIKVFIENCLNRIFPPRQLFFEFQILDGDSETETDIFGCLAEDQEAAEEICYGKGYREFRLISYRDFGVEN